eukprot:scpid106299/ scgid29597/ 
MELASALDDWNTNSSTLTGVSATLTSDIVAKRARCSYCSALLCATPAFSILLTIQLSPVPSTLQPQHRRRPLMSKMVFTVNLAMMRQETGNECSQQRNDLGPGKRSRKIGYSFCHTCDSNTSAQSSGKVL